MSTNSTEEISWISWFCSMQGHDFYCEVDEEYIKDKFNLTGLSDQVPHYHEALNTILDMEFDEDIVHERRGTSEDIIDHTAELLYGLIHARFVLTIRGAALMLEKMDRRQFGVCPRYFCENQAMLPIGLSDVPGEETVKLYCPKCKDIYKPKSARHRVVDGAHFGTGLPHYIFMEHPSLRPKKPAQKFVPKLYGFEIHPLAEKLQHHAVEAAERKRGMRMLRGLGHADIVDLSSQNSSIRNGNITNSSRNVFDEVSD